MSTTAASAFTTTHRMVNRVHHNTADMRSESEITLLAGFAQRSIHVVQISDLSDSGLAIQMHLADFTARQLDLCIITVLGTENRNLSGGTNHSGAFSGDEFDVVNFNTDRDVAKFQGIARLDFSFLAGKDSLPDLEPVRRKDVSLLTVRICNQSDESGTVRIVFDVLDSRRNAVLGTPELLPFVRLFSGVSRLISE